MKLSFYLPVPLDEGCKVTVVLPQQYSTDTITIVRAHQVFGFIQTFSLDNGKLQINDDNSFTIQPCDTYKENDNIATIYI